MSIKNSIVHFVDKNLVTEEVSVKCREQALPSAPELEHLSDQIKKGHRTKAEKYFGYFAESDDEKETEASCLGISLKGYVDESMSSSNRHRFTM